MLKRFWGKLGETERAWRKSFGRDITDPAERKRSHWHVDWLDHGILRRRWHNFAEIAPGVYRSNHPNHDRFAEYAKLGISTVLNLRGKINTASWLFEEETCKRLGLELIDIAMSARSAPPRHTVLELLEIFDTIKPPFLMHCKSGADRTGLTAALYLLIVEGATMGVARQQLSRRYLHFKRSKTGVMDHVLDVYERRNAQSPISVADWLRDEYDPAAIDSSFAAFRLNGYRWPAT
jgi:protein tyrosine/serine phosphatase